MSQPDWVSIKEYAAIYAPTGRVLIPFLGTSGRVGWPAGQWDIWAPVFSWMLLGRRRPRLWVELHRREWWTQPKTWRKDYLRWLTSQRARPILMQRTYRRVPASVAYPKAWIQAQFPDMPFHGTFDWLMALAIALQVKEIAAWGVDYDSSHEEIYQKVGAACWVGFARGRGIRVTLSPGSPLLSNPLPDAQTYGYDYPPWPKGHHPHDWPAESLMEEIPRQLRERA